MAPKKLLVADDSLTIQKVIRLALAGVASGSADGYDIQAVSDGNDAVQQISLFRPDVVLIDVSLPGKSAFEVKRAVNQHRDLHHVRFVLMSSAFEKVDEVQAKEVEFHGRLTKPFDPAHLREVLSQVLSQTQDRDEPTVTLHVSDLLRDQGPPELPPEFPPSFPNDGPNDGFALPEAAKQPEGMPSMPDFPQMPDPTSDPESDIRNLTESTIRMSGLADLGSNHEQTPPAFAPGFSSDDFQWSVQENSLKPSDSMFDSGNATFPNIPQPTVSSQLEFTPPPPAGAPDAFHEEPDPEPAPIAAAPAAPPAAPPTAPPPMPAPATAAAAPTIDFAIMEKKIEELVRTEIENALRKLTQESIPDVAERLIKQEIHKLLTENH